MFGHFLTSVILCLVHEFPPEWVLGCLNHVVVLQEACQVALLVHHDITVGLGDNLHADVRHFGVTLIALEQLVFSQSAAHAGNESAFLLGVIETPEKIIYKQRDVRPVLLVLLVEYTGIHGSGRVSKVFEYLGAQLEPQIGRLQESICRLQYRHRELTLGVEELQELRVIVNQDGGHFLG